MLESVPHSQPQPEAGATTRVGLACADSAAARQRLERFLRIRCAEARTPASKPFRPTVTLSRQAGLNGRDFASRLGRYLDTLDPQNSGPEWTCVDASLVDTLIEHLGAIPSVEARIIPFPTESKLTQQKSVAEEMPIAHSPATLALHRLCELGGAIIVGRGAHCPPVSGNLQSVFRVRLVASPEQRVSQFAERTGMLDLDRAAANIAHIDESRRRRVRRHFHSDLDDPLAFDLVLNLSQIAADTAVAVVGDALLEWAAKQANAAT